MVEYPEDVLKKLEAIAEKSSSDIEQVKAKYEEFFSDPFIQEDPQFVDDNDRHQYCIQVFWNKYILRPPVAPKTIIPIGITGANKTKKGNLTADMFVIDAADGKLKRIVLKGDCANNVKKVLLFHKYENVELGSFRDSVDLIGDDRANFDNPIKVEATPEQIIAKLNFKRCKISEAPNNLSRVGSDGYVDKTDWRIIRGVIASERQCQPDADYQWGFYTITDNTVKDDEPTITPDGRVVPPGFTISTNPLVMQYSRDSQCDFLGTIEKNQKDGRISMRSNCIILIHSPPPEGD